MQSAHPATLTITADSPNGITLLTCRGSWTLPYLSGVESLISNIPLHANAQIDMSELDDLDSSGAALLHLIVELYHHNGFTTTIHHFSTKHERLYSLLYSSYPPKQPAPSSLGRLYLLGYHTYNSIRGIKDFLTYLGESCMWLLYTLLHPSKIRYHSIVSHIYTTGAQALPIIAISAFLIGVVVAYQSIVQLQKFGADIFIVDTIGISLSRELAPLITAIVVAGRSGSAFTAQIGAMKMTQEIDAMKTMGFEPFTFLVWPRVFALMIVMPLLIFFADIIGIFGGMIIAQAHSNLSFTEFLNRLQGALAIKHYIIGIVKGPFFAFLIAIVSTYRGFQVSSNTESIGLYTTKSVVNAIFLVIACDALFSILLTELKL